MKRLKPAPGTRRSTQRPSATRRFHHGNLRQALLDAALAAPDIEGLSLRHLASRLGVTPAAAYRHFASRQDLLAAVARTGFDRLEVRFAAAMDIATPATDGVVATSRLSRLAHAYIAFAQDEPALWRLMFGASAAPYRATAMPMTRPHTYSYLTAALEDLRVSGLCESSPSERDSLFAWSAIHGAAALSLSGIATMPPQDLARDVALRVIAALRSPLS